MKLAQTVAIQQANIERQSTIDNCLRFNKVVKFE